MRVVNENTHPELRFRAEDNSQLSTAKNNDGWECSDILF